MRHSFIKYLDLARSNRLIQKKITSKFKSILKKGVFILGNEVKSLENKFSYFTRAKYSVGVASGLDALILLLKTQNLNLKDEVIVQSNSFIATAICVNHVGAKIKFVDASLENFSVDIDSLEKVITKRTKIVIVTSLYGITPPAKKLLKLARKYKFKIIEDAAQSHGSNLFSILDKNEKYRSPWIGSAFSFYPTKNLGAFGDGGAIITNSKSIRDKIYSLRNYGLSSLAGRYDILGYNSRLDEMHASFLNVKLDEINFWNKKRENLANIYYKVLANNSNIILPNKSFNKKSKWHVFPIRVLLKKRDKLRNYLLKNKIGTSIHYDYPLHLQPLYKKKFGKINMPNSEILCKELLSLPLDHCNTPNEIFRVARKINEFFKVID
jgi:dTDP-4-amino-4,6-dideoxygalactose transaminase